MADVAALKESIRDWARQVHSEAVTDLQQQLDAKVPIGPPREGGGEKLRDNQQVTVQDRGDSFTATIRYTVPQAEFTDKGTNPHPIDGNPTLVFFWPKAGRVVHLRHVDHPGNEGTGWFTDTVTEQGWLDALELVADAVNLG